MILKLSWNTKIDIQDAYENIKEYNPDKKNRETKY